MTYINCPPSVNNLSSFGNSPASRDEKIKVEITGTCVENAQPGPPYHELIRYCDHNGESTYEGECWCKAGHERKNTLCSGTTTFETIRGNLPKLKVDVLIV